MAEKHDPLTKRQFTDERLHNLINQWQQEAADDGHETWDDVGFDFKGESKRRWLSSSTLKLDVDLSNTLRDGPGSVAAAEPLLNDLARFRSQVTA